MLKLKEYAYAWKLPRKVIIRRIIGRKITYTYEDADGVVQIRTTDRKYVSSRPPKIVGGA